MVRLAACIAAALIGPLSPQFAVAENAPVPVSQHEALSRSIPMAIAGSRFFAAGTAPAYFHGVEALGFACTVENVTRWRVRRVRVTCRREGDLLLYEGGFAPGFGSVIFDRVSRDGLLLGGRELAQHVQGMIAASTAPAAPPTAVAEAIRQ